MSSSIWGGRINPHLPACVLCADKGLCLGTPDFEYQICKCPAGDELAARDPQALDSVWKATEPV